MYRDDYWGGARIGIDSNDYGNTTWIGICNWSNFWVRDGAYIEINDYHLTRGSLGRKQRLGIAQAVMENPSILLLDEPMNGLDRSGVEDIRALLQELKNEGKTILIASHIKEDIELLCDTVCKMEQVELRVIR